MRRKKYDLQALSLILPILLLGCAQADERAAREPTAKMQKEQPQTKPSEKSKPKEATQEKKMPEKALLNPAAAKETQNLRVWR